jgi:hypothetical protein
MDNEMSELLRVIRQSQLQTEYAIENLKQARADLANVVMLMQPAPVAFPDVTRPSVRAGFQKRALQ